MAKKWLVVMAMWLMGVAYGNAQEVVWSVDFDSHFTTVRVATNFAPTKLSSSPAWHPKSAYSWAISETVTRSKVV